jgi:hypothetical protein
MPNLADHHSGKIVKVLYMGDSGTGKTGSLTSLVNAGYKLHILDLDNGIDVLVEYVKHECHNRIKNIDYETRRDKIKAGPVGPLVDGVPKAYIQSLQLMTKWNDKTVDPPVDIAPCDWGPEHVFVLDSFTGLGRAAFNWAKGISPMVKDPRQWYHMAQQACEQVLALLTSEAFNCNVVVIAHVAFMESSDGTMRGYANSIGKAIGPIIPTYFNTMVLAQSTRVGQDAKRTIATVPTSMIDLKNPAPFKVDKELPLGTGLATLFETLKETK